MNGYNRQDQHALNVALFPRTVVQAPKVFKPRMSPELDAILSGCQKKVQESRPGASEGLRWLLEPANGGVSCR